MMLHRLLLVVIVVVVVVWGQVPIPRRRLGFVYNSGEANAPVQLDFYIDLICPDSQASLPTVLKVADFYGKKKLQLTTHLFPLPYHRNGFYAAKGAQVVNTLSKGNLTYDWFRVVYADMDDLTTKSTHNISDAEVLNRLTNLAVGLGVNQEIFKQNIDSDTIEMDTRTEWKYVCSRGVVGTPTFMLNDVIVNASPSWSVDDWKKLIDPLFSSPQSTLLQSTTAAAQG